MCDRYPVQESAALQPAMIRSNRCWNLDAVPASAQTQGMERRNERHNVR